LYWGKILKIFQETTTKLHHQWALSWKEQRAKYKVEAENTNPVSPNAQSTTESSINTGPLHKGTCM